MTLPRVRYLLTVLLSSGFFLLASRSEALTEKEIREIFNRGIQFEKEANWESAREHYEALLSQRDYGLRIRDRYHQALRHCRQVRRHQDSSYLKEVLSIEYGTAVKLHNIISNTLLNGSVDKKKLDSAKLFRKGLEELEAALAEPVFIKTHLPQARDQDIQTFRDLLRKMRGDIGSMSRDEAAKKLGEVAQAADFHLQLNATVVVMEFACGSCYAIDEFTVYLTPHQLRELTQSLSMSEAVGVGIKIGIQDNKIVVRDVAPGSPADRANVNPNDQILSIDNKSVLELPLSSVIGMLEGSVGSTVVVYFMSAKDMSMTTVRIQRSATAVSVSPPLLLPNTSIGYLKINGFTEGTVQEVDGALTSLAQSGMKALILDLRDNNGGIFESAIETARRFLATGIITSTLHQDPKFNFVYHAKNPNALKVPMVVLVDGDTASAAEVLAGALKDNNRATLIGQTTFGKGCTQCILKLPSALGGLPTGGMKVTVARFFSPKGVPYSGRGIVPHIMIDERMASSESGITPWMERAVEELNRLVMAQK